MREIKFRGYCDRDSEWRYGYYITDGKIHEINTLLLDDKTLYGSQIDVDSLGQYTGLKDVNGVEIYEGDVVYYLFGGNGYVGFIEYAEARFQVRDKAFRNDLDYALNIEVLGNIYENPELLENK